MPIYHATHFFRPGTNRTLTLACAWAAMFVAATSSSAVFCFSLSARNATHPDELAYSRGGSRVRRSCGRGMEKDILTMLVGHLGALGERKLELFFQPNHALLRIHQRRLRGSGHRLAGRGTRIRRIQQRRHLRALPLSAAAKEFTPTD